MKRTSATLRGLAALLLLMMTLLAGGSGSLAQSIAQKVAVSAEERELVKLLDDNQLVTARRKVDELLKRSPESMVGHYVLGRVMVQSEGNLPKAMAHLGRCRELYEKTYAVHPRSAGAPWQFHRELLYQIQNLAQRMEEFSYQLEILDYHDLLYEPDLLAERTWPLMRLGKFKKAREAAKAAINRAGFQRSLGLNAMCAVEGEALLRKPYFEACLKAFEHAKAADVKGVDDKHVSTTAVHAYNAALAARAALLPERAEKIATEGTRRLAFTSANPWRLLVQLYSDQGRMKEAVDALRDMQAWRTKQPPSIRDQTRAETDVVFSTVLLLAAETKTGMRLLDLAIERPDRRGLSSSSREQALGAHALLRRALARTQGELLAEQASYSDEPGLMSRAYDGAGRSLSVWADEERIVSVLSDTDRLVSTFRVFLRGGIEPVPVWLLGDLIDVLGTGIVAAAIKRARKKESDPGVVPYFDALAAELALARGDEKRALKLAQKALETLPKREALLKARTAAAGARAARDRGKRQLYLSLLEQTMQLDPSVIRRLGMSIPAKIKLAQKSRTGQLVAEKLDDSPRLDSESKAFVVDVLGTGRDLQVCLRGPQGAKLSCAVASPPDTDPKTKKPKTENDEEYATRVAAAFHKKALAMPLGLSGVDLSSLDGSTTVAEQAARDRLKGILDGAVKDKK